MKDYLFYLLIRGILCPISLLPYRVIHALGRFLGYLTYCSSSKFRKRSLSNLSLASDLKLTHQEKVGIAIQSCQNMIITTLEYCKIAREKNLDHLVTCLNPEKAKSIYDEGKGVIFFCAHQSNWELLFLEGTSRMKGTAIGRPIKNPYLYRYILSVRERFGGKIITPKEAVKEGMKALKRGEFLGIVGDQGLPESGYYSNFLGTDAWTSPLPAVLSHRMHIPLFYAATRRIKGKYQIIYSDPIFPDLTLSTEENTRAMMSKVLVLLEEEIKHYPGQWLWTHNKWKKQSPKEVKGAFRFDSICIIAPDEKEFFNTLLPHFGVFREIYPLETLSIMVKEEFQDALLLSSVEKIVIKEEKDFYINDYRFKLVFNLSKNKNINKHFLNLSAFKVIDIEDLKKITNMRESDNYSAILKKALLNAPQ